MGRIPFILFSLAFAATLGAQTLNPNGGPAIPVGALENSVGALVFPDGDIKKPVGIIVKADNAGETARAFREKGIPVRIIDGTTLVARPCLAEVGKINEMKGIRRLTRSRRHRLLTDSVRRATHADYVQAGYGLETPFTGKGVLIGVVDEGFEYRHLAFLDSEGNSRVKAVWDQSLPDNVPTTEIPKGGDDFTETNGHATHVTAIAAGSKVGGCNYYGMAPEADIVMIASDLEDDNLLAACKYIKDVAQKDGQPWVVNMSIGSLLGPHDGTDDYSQAMEHLLTEGGGILVGAMGNEGQERQHVMHEFGHDGECVELLLSNEGDDIDMTLWAQDTDSATHLDIRPYLYFNGEKDYRDDAFWAEYCTSVISPVSRKQGFSATLPLKALLRKGSGSSYGQFGLEIRGTANTVLHGWAEIGYGVFQVPTTSHLQPDARYCVSEGAATVPSAIAVGAYTAKNSVRNLKGTDYSYSRAFPMQQICDFSNYGPYLGNEQKPTVCAPGAVVCSATSKAQSDFNSSSYSLTNRIVGGNNEYYYYSFKSGTSMSTPVVSGIIALWLQANPNLTSADVKQIIKATSTTDRFVTDPQLWGYGKINAYEGLKMALTLATGIDNLPNAASSVSLQRRADCWKILFNRATSTVSINVVRPDGTPVWHRNIAQAQQGSEQIVPFANLPHGTYIVSIRTPKEQLVRKFIK